MGTRNRLTDPKEVVKALMGALVVAGGRGPYSARYHVKKINLYDEGGAGWSTGRVSRQRIATVTWNRRKYEITAVRYSSRYKALIVQAKLDSGQYSPWLVVQCFTKGTLTAHGLPRSDHMGDEAAPAHVSAALAWTFSRHYGMNYHPQVQT